MKFWYFCPTSFFFRQKEITLWGQKRTALFQTYNWEKSIFFKALERVFAEIYARSLGLDIADCGNSLDGILVLSYVSGWIHIGRIGMLCVAVFITNYIRNDRNEKVHGNYSTPSISVKGKSAAWHLEVNIFTLL